MNFDNTTPQLVSLSRLGRLRGGEARRERIRRGVSILEEGRARNASDS
jgi:hypothetical protein